MWIENGTGTYEALTFWLFCAVKRSRCHTCQTAILINSDRPLFLLTFPPRARRTSERIYVRKKCVEHTWRVGCWAGAGYVLHSYFRLAWGLMHTWHNNHYSFINVYSGVRTTPACYVLCERATTSYGCFCVLCVRALLRCRKTFTTTAYEYCATKQQEVPVYVVGYFKGDHPASSPYCLLPSGSSPCLPRARWTSACMRDVWGVGSVWPNAHSYWRQQLPRVHERKKKTTYRHTPSQGQTEIQTRTVRVLNE